MLARRLGCPGSFRRRRSDCPSPYALAMGYLLAAGLLWCWSWRGAEARTAIAQTSEK